MRSTWPLLLVLMPIAGLSGAATALTLDQQRCSGPDLDLVISSCTAVIQSGHETPQNLAFAFNNRGAAYIGKRQFLRAIQDLDQAIRLDPNHASALNNRGNYYADTHGQYDRAIRDYDLAIRLNPNYADAFYNRGNAYAKKHQYDHAIQDYDEAIRLNPNDADALRERAIAKQAKGDHP